MNMIKKTDGFTLVELIVVIAILAILGGVAVPAYSGYINSANEAADTTQLAAIKTAAMATFATEGTVTEISVTASGGVISAISVKHSGAANAVTVWSSTDNNPDFITFFGSSTMPTLKAWTNGAVWYASATTGEGAHDAGWVANAVS